MFLLSIKGNEEMKVNTKMKQDFLTGDFGKSIKKNLIDGLERAMNDADAGELSVTFGFLSDLKEDEVGISITVKLWDGVEKDSEDDQ